MFREPALGGGFPDLTRQQKKVAVGQNRFGTIWGQVNSPPMLESISVGIESDVHWGYDLAFSQGKVSFTVRIVVRDDDLAGSRELTEQVFHKRSSHQASRFFSFDM